MLPSSFLMLVSAGPMLPVSSTTNATSSGPHGDVGGGATAGAAAAGTTGRNAAAAANASAAVNGLRRSGRDLVLIRFPHTSRNGNSEPSVTATGCEPVVDASRGSAGWLFSPSFALVTLAER